MDTVTSTQKTISVAPSMTEQQACEIYGSGEDAVVFARLKLTQQLAVQVAKTAATRRDDASETGLDPSMARRSWQRSIDVWQMPRWMAAVAVLLACVCFWQALPVSSRPGATPAVAGQAGKSQNDASLGRSLNSNRKLLTRRIDEIRPGMRVLAENPELHGIDVPQLQIDQKSTRLVRFHQVKPDGYELTVDRLMSTEELAEAAVDVLLAQGPPNDPRPWVGKSIDVSLWNTLLGQTLHVELPEMGVEGPATIVSIEPCPAIEPDDGTGRRLVTSTFKHTVNQVINLQIEGQNQPIGTTPNHPFWSEDRQAFVRADSLHVGERLGQADGRITKVGNVTTGRTLPTQVYNLEIAGHHVYHVSNDGVLVHNSCHRHHLIPKFLGGDPKQPLIKITAGVHRELHRLLRENLRAAGITLNIGGRGGSRLDWARYMAANPGAQRQAMDAVLDASRTIDFRHGTNVTQAVWSNILNGLFATYP